MPRNITFFKIFKNLFIFFSLLTKAKLSSTYLRYNKLFLKSGKTYNSIKLKNLLANVGPMAIPSCCEQIKEVIEICVDTLYKIKKTYS